MQKQLLLATTLLAAAFLPAASAATSPDLPAPPGVPDAADAFDGCVQYAYVADYHWYWVCVDPKGGACAVYFKEQHGVTVTKECALPGVTTADLACVEYMYIADYHWYWVCVDPKGGACAVYFKEQHGATVTKTCPLPTESTATTGGCVLFAQDLDYSHYLCVEPSNSKCPVYTKRESGGHSTTSCPGAPAGSSTVAPEASCIPTSGGLDYHSYLCVDAGNPKCAVYTLTHNDWDGVKKTCVPPLP